ncbi:dienelactone hydrolase family protein [Chloroflexota bacterium]
MIVRKSDSSDLEALPIDTGGEHQAYIQGETEVPYGYYIYVPEGGSQNPAKYPVLVFLHGIGECGNSARDVDELELVLVHGPPHMVRTGEWDPPCPMIVASPQTPVEEWQPEKVDVFIRYVIENYPADQSRIYLTGLSMGGDGVYSYLIEMGDRSLVAAAVTICGEGDAGKAKKAKVPVWIFHGEFDDEVQLQTAIDMAKGFSNTPEAKLTVFPGMGHGGWSETYSSSGMGTESEKYDPFDISIYDWLLSFSSMEE